MMIVFEDSWLLGESCKCVVTHRMVIAELNSVSAPYTLDERACSRLLAQHDTDTKASEWKV